MARKKPTMKEMAGMMGEVMQRTELLKRRLIQTELILSSYIELNKDEKKLQKFIEKKSEGLSKTRTEKDLDNK